MLEARRILAGLLLLACGALGKKPPVALEAAFKDRISAKLASSAEAAALHLASRLNMGGETFGGYELEVPDGDTEKPVWQNRCTGSWMDPTKDSVETCAMRQLQALTAICDVPGFFERNAASKDVIHDHLKALAGKEVKGLGLKRTKFDGVDIWMHRKTPDGGADDLDASPALQASVLMAMVRCADAIGERHHFQEAESWFAGLAKVYPNKMWDSKTVNYHRSSIIWESLALVASHLPRDSSFFESLQGYLKNFEDFLHKQWEDTPSTWSFSSARAVAMRIHSGSAKGKNKRQVLKKWAQEHVDRFMGTSKGGASPKLSDGPDGAASKEGVADGILAKIGSMGYTCGPLQGLAAVAGVLSDAELVQVTLQLLEKDVDTYQIGAENEGFAKSLALVGTEVGGAFYRDDGQLKMEKRRSLRIDDASQCVIALSQALRMLDGIVAVEVDPADQPQKKSSGPGGDEM